MGIKVHFNHPYRSFDKRLLITDMVSAKQRVVMASAWFTDTDIAEAFIQSTSFQKIFFINRADMRRSKGQAYLKIARYFDSHSSALDNFSKIHVIGSENWEEGVMHHKFVIIDDNVVWTGSYNFTFQAAKNHETILRIDDKAVVDEFLFETIILAGDESLLYEYFSEPYQIPPGSYSDDKFCCYWCEKTLPLAKAAVTTQYLSSCKKCYELQEDPYWKESFES